MQQLVILLVMASLLAGYGCTQSDYVYRYLLPPDGNLQQQKILMTMEW
jgi:hypothetical protein